MKQKFSLKNRRGQEIFGEVEFPTGSIAGTALIQHGRGQHMYAEEIQIVKELFLQHNIQTVIFDTPNLGNSSNGNFEATRVGLHAKDFEDLASWVQDQKWFAKPFFVVGKSLGGYSAIRYTEVFPEKVDYVLGIVPFIAGELSRQTMEDDILKEWKETGILERKSRTQKGMIRRLPYAYLEESLNHDLRKNASKVTMPILLIAGEHDSFVYPEHVQKLFEQIKSPQKSFVVLKGRGHDFRKEEKQKKEDRERLTKVVQSWIEEQFKE